MTFARATYDGSSRQSQTTPPHNISVDDDSSSTISTDSIDWREFYTARYAARQAYQAQTSSNNPGPTNAMEGEERGTGEWTGIPPPEYDWDDDLPEYGEVDLENGDGEGEYDSRGSVQELVWMVVWMVVLGLVVGVGTWWAVMRERKGWGGRA